MGFSSARVILWGSRLLVVAVALWWPGIWRDPIYSPRQARLAGDELRLPNGTAPATPEDQALAIFWAWEHRTLVTTHWVFGPYRGLRDAEGWRQTLVVMVIVWSVGSGALWLLAWLTPASSGWPRRRKGVLLLTTPLWRLLSLQRKPDQT